VRHISPTTKYVLKAFIPYSKENLKLSFKPRLFFNELEKKTRVKERTLRSAYRRAINKGFIEVDNDNIPRLTKKGRLKLKPYAPSRLGKDAKIVIVFDIPEAERNKRNHLRLLLHELSFKKCSKVFGPQSLIIENI